MAEPKYVSVAYAADLLGITPRRVQQLIKAGIIKAEPLEGSRALLIPLKDLRIVKELDRPRGRPKKSKV